jgi:hypothetical protein
MWSEVMELTTSTIMSKSKESRGRTKGGCYKIEENATAGPEVPFELLGYQPDLISAAATNGKEGYVRREDFMLEPSEIETNGKPFMIPVYDLEGNVIGEFELNR